MINGNDLINWGFEPGPWFKGAIERANELAEQGVSDERIVKELQSFKPQEKETIDLQSGVDIYMNITPNGEDEWKNYNAVKASMCELVKTPTIKEAAVMPDACPAGPNGTIPVGGVVKVENAVHPGMHSADICCSVALTNLGHVDPAEVMKHAVNNTHFGGGGRKGFNPVKPGAKMLREFVNNPFLDGLETFAKEHMATQGDGNHFLFVGTLASTGETCLVTHHGSRKPGAMLYKRGMRVADKYRRELSPRTLKQNAWIPMDTDDGRNYWEALQIIRSWTKKNHFGIHDLVLKGLGVEGVERYWNEHNFVFERNGFYYHGKGATPVWDALASDDPDVKNLRLVPLNMAQPVLIVDGTSQSEYAINSMGFAPHGAGRNLSRSEHIRRSEGSPSEIVRRETKGLDVRFWTGAPDISELPSAYKNAHSVRRQIENYQLADVMDEVMPYGCIMAGNWKKR